LTVSASLVACSEGERSSRFMAIKRTQSYNNKS
jgi:hypothetical protein